MGRVLIYQINLMKNFQSKLNPPSATKNFRKGITKRCTHLRSAPSNPARLHPAHFSLLPALCKTLNVIRTKIQHVIGQFPKIQAKKLWYLGGVDSECRLIFLEIELQNLFLGKFSTKKSNLFVLPENWHTWHLEDADSYSDISFLNFQPKIHFWANVCQKSQNCPFCLKIGTQSILRMLIFILTLVFPISNPKSIFGQIRAENIKSLCFD